MTATWSDCRTRWPPRASASSAARERFFGGTSNHWGGWSRPLDPIDFEERGWVPLSGWPLARDALDEGYRRAHEVLEIDTTDYDAASHVEPAGLLPADEASGFRNALLRFSPPVRFRTTYRDDLAARPDVHCFLHATVVDLEHADGVVSSALVRTSSDNQYRIRARRFVLATGGLEVARLLLHTASDDAPALGNASGYVGRCFMEHFGYTPGYIQTRSGLKYFRHRGRDGHSLMPVLSPRPARMHELAVNNCCLLLTASEPDADWPPDALQTPGLARNLGDGAWRYRVTMINEPTPNPDSRVTLSGERDALGMRKLILDWRIMERDFEGIDRTVRELVRWLGRTSGLIEADDVHEMLAWENSGFSLDAAVRVGAHDRTGLERLLRYCARPPFALERLERLDDERVVYRLPKPQRDGTTALTLTPMELIDHLAALIPPPRRRRHRYHGVLAPNSPLRAAAVVLGRDLTDDPSASAELAAPRRAPAPNARSPARYLWVMLP